MAGISDELATKLWLTKSAVVACYQVAEAACLGESALLGEAQQLQIVQDQLLVWVVGRGFDVVELVEKGNLGAAFILSRSLGEGLNILEASRVDPEIARQFMDGVFISQQSARRRIDKTDPQYSGGRDSHLVGLQALYKIESRFAHPSIRSIALHHEEDGAINLQGVSRPKLSELVLYLTCYRLVYLLRIASDFTLDGSFKNEAPIQYSALLSACEAWQLPTPQADT
jgi:hypothetical protein